MEDYSYVGLASFLCGANKRGQINIKAAYLTRSQMVTRAMEKSTKRKEEREEK